MTLARQAEHIENNVAERHNSLQKKKKKRGGSRGRKRPCLLKSMQGKGGVDGKDVSLYLHIASYSISQRITSYTATHGAIFDICNTGANVSGIRTSYL